MAHLDLADIQGNILRGYNMPLVRHFVLHIDDPAGCRRFLAHLTHADGKTGLQITTAEHWSGKPRYALNIGFTSAGLQAVGLADDSLRSFPEEFRQGAALRAEIIGDTDESAPANWIGGLSASEVKPSEAHILLSIHAMDRQALADMDLRLNNMAEARSSLSVLSYQDGEDLPESRVHFGYVDGLSQPHVEGGARPKSAGADAPVPTGEFLLGYPSQFTGFIYPVPTPSALGNNGTFFAYRIFRQDVAGFETYLQTKAAEIGKDKEWVAARLCGRWRNGVPLELSPDTDHPVPPIPRNQFNNFDYVPAPGSLDGFDDARGYRCPISSHIRRSYPRNEQVAGGGGTRHRIIRRALPYGPVYNPDSPDDGRERGLLMQAVCVSLLDQFEFLMTEWINGETFAARISCKDPFLGNSGPDGGQLEVPQENGPPIVLTGLSRFVVTRGSLYCFMPSITGLKYLASLPV